MRIGVDAHVLAGIPQGSRTYVKELYREVLEKDTENEYVFFGHWEDSKPFGDRVEYVSFSSRARFKRLTLESGRLIKKHGIELYHAQYISPLWLPVPSLVTIHDVFPDAAKGGQAPYAVYRLALESGLFKEIERINSLALLRRL